MLELKQSKIFLICRLVTGFISVQCLSIKDVNDQFGYCYRCCFCCLEVEAACRILGVKTSLLVDALTQPAIRVGEMSIKKSQNLRKVDHLPVDLFYLRHHQILLTYIPNLCISNYLYFILLGL